MDEQTLQQLADLYRTGVAEALAQAPEEMDAVLFRQVGANRAPTPQERYDYYRRALTDAVTQLEPNRRWEMERALEDAETQVLGAPEKSNLRVGLEQAADNLAFNVPSTLGWLPDYNQVDPRQRTAANAGMVAGGIGSFFLPLGLAGRAAQGLRAGTKALQGAKRANTVIRGTMAGVAGAQELGRMGAETRSGRQYHPLEYLLWPTLQAGSQYAGARFGAPPGSGIVRNVGSALAEGATTMGLMNAADRRPILSGAPEGAALAAAMTGAAHAGTRWGPSLWDRGTAAVGRRAEALKRALGVPPPTNPTPVDTLLSRRTPTPQPTQDTLATRQPPPAAAPPVPAALQDVAALVPTIPRHGLAADDPRLLRDDEVRKWIADADDPGPREVPGDLIYTDTGQALQVAAKRSPRAGKAAGTILVDPQTGTPYEGTKDALSVFKRSFLFKDPQGNDIYTEPLDADWLPIKWRTRGGVQLPLAPTAGAQATGWTAYGYHPARVTDDGQVANVAEVWARSADGETRIIPVSEIADPELVDRLARLGTSSYIQEAKAGVGPARLMDWKDVSGETYQRGLAKGLPISPELQAIYAAQNAAIQRSLGKPAVRVGGRPRKPKQRPAPRDVW